MKILTRREAEKYRIGYAIIWTLLLALPMFLPLLDKLLHLKLQPSEILFGLLVPALTATALFLFELSYAFAKGNSSNPNGRCDKMSQVLIALVFFTLLSAACIFIHEYCIIGAFISICFMLFIFGWLKWLTTDLLPYVTLPNGPIQVKRPTTEVSNDVKQAKK